VNADVTLPPVLDRFPEIVRAAARVGLAVAVEEAVTAAKVSPFMPVNTGTGRRSLATAPIIERGDTLSSGIVAVGIGANYMPTMESGRRPGARGPSFRHLLMAPGFRDAKTTDESAQRGGWVNRRLQSRVAALASKLEADEAGKGRKLSARARRRLVQRARFLIARGVAQKVHDRGIEARGFAMAQRANLVRNFSLRFTAELRRQGAL